MNGGTPVVACLPHVGPEWRAGCHSRTIASLRSNILHRQRQGTLVHLNVSTGCLVEAAFLVSEHELCIDVQCSHKRQRGFNPCRAGSYLSSLSLFRMMEYVRDLLPDTMVIHAGHRASLERFHEFVRERHDARPHGA